MELLEVFQQREADIIPPNADLLGEIPIPFLEEKYWDIKSYLQAQLPQVQLYFHGQKILVEQGFKMDTERALLNYSNYYKAAKFQIPLFKYFAIKRFLKDLSWQFVRYKVLQFIDHNKLFLLGQDWRQLVERYQNIEEKIKSLKIEVIQNQKEIQSQLSKNIYKQYPNLTFHVDKENALHIVKHYNDQLTEEQLQNFRQRYEIVKQKLEFDDHPFYQKIYWQYLCWNSKEIPSKIFSQFGVQYEWYTIQIEKDYDFQNFQIIGNRNQIARVKQHILNLLKQQVLENQSVEIGPYFLTLLGENQI